MDRNPSVSSDSWFLFLLKYDKVRGFFLWFRVGFGVSVLCLVGRKLMAEKKRKEGRKKKKDEKQQVGLL